MRKMVRAFLLLCLPFVCLGRQIRGPVQQGLPAEQSEIPYFARKPGQCGTSPNWSPCVDKTTADDAFQDCCKSYVNSKCWDLCKYETDFQTAINKVKDTVLKKGCSLKQMSPLLYCASQNRDNTACCKELGLADAQLKVGDRCLRMCDIRGNNGIGTLTAKDLTCLGNWNVLMYCHHSGLDFY